MRDIVRCAIAVAMVFDSSSANAQGGVGAFRLGLGSSVYLGESTTIEGTDGERDVESSTIVAGLGAPGFGASVAYVGGEYFAIGGRLNYTSQAFSVEGSSAEQSASSLLALLGFEILFLHGGRVRPELHGVFGFISRNELLEDPDADFEREASYSGIAYGFGGGVHFFATDTFSITPAITLFWSRSPPCGHARVMPSS